jgi:hypothetical protein
MGRLQRIKEKAQKKIDEVAKDRLLAAKEETSHRHQKVKEEADKTATKLNKEVDKGAARMIKEAREVAAKVTNEVSSFIEKTTKNTIDSSISAALAEIAAKETPTFHVNQAESSKPFTVKTITPFQCDMYSRADFYRSNSFNFQNDDVNYVANFTLISFPTSEKYRNDSGLMRQWIISILIIPVSLGLLYLVLRKICSGQLPISSLWA